MSRFRLKFSYLLLGFIWFVSFFLFFGKAWNRDRDEYKYIPVSNVVFEYKHLVNGYKVKAECLEFNMGYPSNNPPSLLHFSKEDGSGFTVKVEYLMLRESTFHAVVESLGKREKDRYFFVGLSNAR